jgi:hypothetical protein
MVCFWEFLCRGEWQKSSFFGKLEEREKAGPGIEKFLEQKQAKDYNSERERRRLEKRPGEEGSKKEICSRSAISRETRNPLDKKSEKRTNQPFFSKSRSKP